MRLRKRAEPVMFVRSPTLTNSESSSTVSGSSPDRRSAGRDRGDVRGRGPAAAADHVHEAGAGELREDGGGLLRRLVVLAEGVGQAGVRVAGDVRVGDPRELGQ